MRTRWAIAALLLMSTPLAAVDLMTEPQSIRDAVAIGQSSLASERTRFQQGYRVPVAKPPVDYLEIVTPFRRVELAAEERAASGDRTFGEKQGRETLAASDRLDIIVELTFHPLNTFVGVPDYLVQLIPAGGGEAIEPLGTERVPRFGARMDGRTSPIPPTTVPARKGPGQPVLGGTMIVHFDMHLMDAARSYDVVVGDRAAGQTRMTELARARIDLARIR